MFTLASNSQSPEELKAVLESHGIEVGEVTTADPLAEPSEVTESSRGESPAGDEVDPIAAAMSDTADTTSQEETPEAKTPQPKPEKAKPEGKFEPRRAQLEKKLSRVYEELDLEKGSKAVLEGKLAALEAELAKLKPVEEAKPPVEVGPVRPKRPTLESCGWDDEAFATANEKYEADLDSFYDAKSKLAVKQELEAREQERLKRQEQEKADQVYNGFVEKRDKLAAAIPDYQSLREEAGDYQVPDLVELAIIQSDIPAVMINYFDRDQVNGGHELNRIAALDPIQQTRELTKLEMKLAATTKPGKGKPDEAAPRVVNEAPPEKKPVVTKVKAQPVEAPIEPIGVRTTGRTPTLNDAKDIKEYIRLRNEGVIR